MKVSIDKDQCYTEPEILIRCREIDQTLQDVITYISAAGKTIIGEAEDEHCFLSINDILYFESVDKTVFIYTSEQVYKTSAKLYILEEQLHDTYFTRVSKTTILNLKKLRSVKAGKNYTLTGTLFNGEKVIISRHYVQLIKEKLGV